MKLNSKFMLAAIAAVTAIGFCGCDVTISPASMSNGSSSASSADAQAESGAAAGTTADWDNIFASLEHADLSGSGLFINQQAAKDDVKDSGYITFNNYESDFRSVPYQLDVCYGKIMRPDTNDNSCYDTPCFEINIVNNSDTNQFFYGVYDKDGNNLYKDGTWFLSDDEAASVSGWLASCRTAMGI